MSLDLYNSFSPEKRNLLVLDDQLIEAAKSDQVEKYFVQGSHHRNLTIALITQNIFEKGKAMRTSNLNTQYLVVYKNPRDKGSSVISWPTNVSIEMEKIFRSTRGRN